jgi:hypothetical protein
MDGFKWTSSVSSDRLKFFRVFYSFQAFRRGRPDAVCFFLFGSGRLVTGEIVFQSNGSNY